MRRPAAIALVAVALAALAGLGFAASAASRPRYTTAPAVAADPVSPRAVATRAAYLRAVDSLDATLAALGAATTPDEAARAFRVARLAYKRIEALAEYYTPVTARAMNGPVLPHADEDDPNDPNKVLQPTGFQVIEEALFPESAPDWRETLAREVAGMRSGTKRLEGIALEMTPTDGHVFDAARLEIARVATLGLAGFDAPITNDGVVEGAAALRGVAATLRTYAGAGAAYDTARARLERAAAWLEASGDFERLDRLAFIAGYANPAARAVDSLRRALGVALPPGDRAWRTVAATVFDRDAWDPHAYAAPGTPRPTAEAVALGQALFFDARLSGDGTRSCATCHQPSRAFTDGLARRAALRGAHDDGTGRNTPTVLEVGLQPASFFDQRTTYLEDQVTDVVGNGAEMRHSVDGAARTLGADAGTRARFAAAFGEAGDSTVTGPRLRRALAAYLRSLVRHDSRWDRAARGDTAALTVEERRGFTTFMGKAKCGTCHFAPLFNGVTPPNYVEAEPEVIGVLVAPGVHRLDPDRGRGAVSRVPLHEHAFKTPTLRNVALTAPYMHNGAFRTLEEVVDFYDHGGAAGVGVRLDNQTLPADSLHLTRREKADLVAFLMTLTDTSGTAGTAPR